VVIAKSDPVSRDLVSNLTLATQDPETMAPVDREVQQLVLERVAEFNKQREEIEAHLSEYWKEDFKLPRIILLGFKDWCKEVKKR
jgi:hypothetical protein